MFRFNVKPKYSVVVNSDKRTVRSSSMFFNIDLVSESTESVEYSSISSNFDYYISGITSLRKNKEHLVIFDSKGESVDYQIVAYPNKNFKVMIVAITVATFFRFVTKFTYK